MNNGMYDKNKIKFPGRHIFGYLQQALQIRKHVLNSTCCFCINAASVAYHINIANNYMEDI